MARVREILAGIEITTQSRARQRAARTGERATLEGSLDDVMLKLSNVLEENYATNVSKGETVPWDFDYVVTDDSPTKGAIEIYTRLFHPTDTTMGSIFYGRTVMRIASDSYLLWADE